MGVSLVGEWQPPRLYGSSPSLGSCQKKTVFCNVLAWYPEVQLVLSIVLCVYNSRDICLDKLHFVWVRTTL